MAGHSISKHLLNYKTLLITVVFVSLGVTVISRPSHWRVISRLLTLGGGIRHRERIVANSRVNCTHQRPIEPVHIGFMSTSGPRYKMSFPWWDTKRHQEIKEGKPAQDNDSVRQITELLSQIPPGSVFVDVGACNGGMTFAGAAKGHPTIAIDPISYNVAKLCEGLQANVEMAAFKEDMVQIFHAAAGDEVKDQISMTRPSDEVGFFDQSSLSRAAVHQKQVTTETIPMVTVDSLVGENVKVGMVKIDVQGFEYAVLQGMEEVLKSQPKFVFYEENATMIRQAGFKPGACQTLLESNGYQCKNLGNDILCTIGR